MSDKQQRQQRKWAENDQHERDAALRAFMAHSQGRRWVNWLLSTCHIGMNPFAQNALTTAHNCGEMNIGLQVQAQAMNVAPNFYLKMLEEAENEQRARTGTDPNADSESDADT